MSQQKEVEIQDKYLDPENTPDILSRMKNLSTLGEMKLLVDDVFPEWFVTIMEVYCSDYPHLMTNWLQICKMSKARPTQIMIVEDLIDDNTHSLIRIFAENFTRAGFSVRRKREYFPCENCASAVPNAALWQLFKDKGFKVPEKWDAKCRECQ